MHPETRRHGEVIMTSFCTSQRRHRYVSNETPNDVSVERHQNVSGVRLHYVNLQCHDEVLKKRNDDDSSVRLHDPSKKSQMKHPTKSQCTSPRCLSGTYPRRHISTSLLRLL